jgi:hypothetical protein
MLIYNVTTKVDWAIAEEWLQWMKDVHMPAVVETGCFEKQQIVRLLEVDDEEGPTYAAQYFATSHHLYNDYIQNHAPHFRKEVNDKWGDQFVSFRTLMELVN